MKTYDVAVRILLRVEAHTASAAELIAKKRAESGEKIDLSECCPVVEGPACEAD